MNILVVDDNEDTVEVLSEFLMQVGHTVDTALTGRDAIARTATLNHDVIIMDIVLPDIDGYSAAREIRKHRLFMTPIRMIAISGTPYDPSHPHAAEARFDKYLLKPVNIEQLLSVIEGWS